MGLGAIALLASAPVGSGEAPSTFKEWIQKVVYERLGVWGLLALAVLSLAGLVWWQWDYFKKLPGVAGLLQWLSQKPLPRADSNRFSVALAHLERDRNAEYEELIRAELQEVQGI